MTTLAADISLKDIIVIFSILVMGFSATIAMIEILATAERNKVRESHQKEVKELQEAWQKERQDLLDRLMARDLTEAKIAQKISSNVERKTVSRSANTKRLIEEAQKLGGSD